MSEKWISVEERLPELDEYNCCMDDEDYDSYSKPVLAFDESEAEWFKASYDGREKVWAECTSGVTLRYVTHWMPGPEGPEVTA